jgi:ribosomal protein S18 acetylase RimI-like enzyme
VETIDARSPRRVQFLDALERAAARAWPATVQRSAPGGWLLRATPGLDRGRSNHALPPCRELSRDELPAAIERVRAFARRHSIRAGIQVSPLELHDSLQRELDDGGWTTNWPVLVMVGAVAAVTRPAEAAGHELLIGDRATPEWLRAWDLCEPGRDVEAHAQTVFELLEGRAQFARLGERAVAIGVEDRGLLGLFCVAVAPSQRRRGLGSAIVGALLARTSASAAYLQVERSNAAAVSMYERLGFGEAYRYCHRTEAG